MAIYDMAGAIQQPNIVGAYQQGIQFRNALADLAAKRAEEQRQIEIRNGLAQFYNAAQPEQRAMQVSGPNPLQMAAMGANPGAPSLLRGMNVSNADYRAQMARNALPTVAEQVTPAVPGGFDYQGAADYLARNGEFQQAGALAQLRKFTDPESAKFGLNPQVGINPQTGKPEFFVTNEQGMPRFLGVQDQPKAIEPPKVRTLKVGGREVSQEWNGRQWVTVAEAPRDVPEAPKPTLVRTESGFEWVYPGQNPAGKPPAAAGASTASEDERKAAGWLKQMNKGEADMREAMRIDPSSAKPGLVESLPVVPEALKNSSRSPARQKFLQGANAFSEAALRMATGAGINESEAKQKVAELTPQWGDSDAVIAQKRESLRMYIEAARARAGRAIGSDAPAAVPAPAPIAQPRPTAPGQKPSLDDIFGGRR